MTADREISAMLSGNKLFNNNLDIIITAIDSVKPANLFLKTISLAGDKLTIQDKIFCLSDFRNIYITGSGKASAYMAREIEKILGDRIINGIVSTKYSHAVECERIKIIEAGHPIPDENSQYAGDLIFRLAQKADADDLIINLISGGGSALMEKPAEGLKLSDLQITNELLIRCGASITEINAVRKELSIIKGGGLAAAAYPAKIISLIISDIIGDPVELIASGPTAFSYTAVPDVLNILTKYDIEKHLSENIVNFFNHEKNKNLKTSAFHNENRAEAENFIIGNNKTALETARARAESLGFNTSIINAEIQGDVNEAARMISNHVKEIGNSNLTHDKPVCILFGGEPTVNVQGNGIGGRNQHLALLCLIELKNTDFNYCLISCGTDGTDGPTDAAGAVASNEIYNRASRKELNIEKYLLNNDSYNFFNMAGGLIKTGPTGTNVMDIISVLIDRTDNVK